MPPEKRLEERSPCKIEAKIVLPDVDNPLSCLVSDISERGACLSISERVLLPARFELLLPVIDEIVDRRSVELRWRRDETLGVSFE